MARAIDTNIYCKTCQKSLMRTGTKSYAKALMDTAKDYANGRTIAYWDVPMEYSEEDKMIAYHIGNGHEVIMI